MCQESPYLGQVVHINLEVRTFSHVQNFFYYTCASKINAAQGLKIIPELALVIQSPLEPCYPNLQTSYKVSTGRHNGSQLWVFLCMSPYFTSAHSFFLFLVICLLLTSQTSVWISPPCKNGSALSLSLGELSFVLSLLVYTRFLELTTLLSPDHVLFILASQGHG